MAQYRALIKRAAGGTWKIGAGWGLGLAAAAVLFAGSPSTVANRALGQPDLVHNVANNFSGAKLYLPSAVAIDASGHIYVADRNNHRVLGFKSSASAINDASAELVIGQPDFFSALCNGGAAGPQANNLCYPAGVAVDGSGNLYVADAWNNRVLEYDAPFISCGSSPCLGPAATRVFGQHGSFTAGGCNDGTAPGDVNGVGSDSLCLSNSISGWVAVDAGGRLYIADSDNNRVLEYDTPLSNQSASLVFGQNGTFTTSACNDGKGANDLNGVGPDSLCSPRGLALNGDGNLFIADTNNNRVLEYDTPSTNQNANLVFGQSNDFTANSCNGGASPSAKTLCHPVGLAVDGSGKLYIADGQNSRVLEFNTPLTNQSADLVFGQDGNFSGGSCDNGNALGDINGLGPDSLCSIAGIAVAPNGSAIAGVLFIADASNNRVPVYDTPLSNQSAQHVFGQTDFVHNSANTPDAVGLHSPQAVAVDQNGHLYVADKGNNRVLGYRNAASLRTGAPADMVLGQPDFQSSSCNNGTGGLGPDSLCNPTGVAADSSGNLYVADANDQRILEYAAPFNACGGTFPCVGPAANIVFGQNGSFTSAVCNGGKAPGDVDGVGPDSLCLSGAAGVATDASGHLYIADIGNNRILEFNTPLTNQTANLVLGQNGSFTAHKCNVVGPDSLCNPGAIAVDSSGRLYVADILNSRVLVYNAPLTSQSANLVLGQNGKFTTNTCNNGAATGDVNGVGPDSLCNPGGIGLDSSGRLYIADFENRVLEYDSPLTRQNADLVFGQDASFTTTACNGGTVGGDVEGLGPDSLCLPTGAAVDGAGNLYIVDSVNNRVLAYDQPATPTPSPTPTPTRTPTWTPTLTPSPTPTTTRTHTPTPTLSPSQTPTSTGDSTHSSTPSSSPSQTGTPTASLTPAATPTNKPSPTRSVRPTSRPTQSASRTPSATRSRSPTPRPTSKPTASPRSSPSPTKRSTASPTRTQKPTSRPTSTPSTRPTPTRSAKPSPTPSAKRSPSVSKKPTPTATKKPAATLTRKPTPTATRKQTSTATGKPTSTVTR